MKLLPILASVLLLGLGAVNGGPGPVNVGPAPPKKPRLTGTGPITCTYPSWKCDCKVYYDCENDGEFPEKDAELAVAGVLHDLAPSDYPLEMSGERWRRNEYNQEEFCRTECTDRMNAFLKLTNGEFSDFSNSAVCIKLLNRATSPFSQDSMKEPCCSIYLLYGRKWCQEKWYVEMGSVRCLTYSIISMANLASGAAGGSASYMFSVEADCPTDGTKTFNFCSSGPPECPPL